MKKITLDGITSTENIFEGHDIQGARIQLRGRFIYNEDHPVFEGKISGGPSYLEDQDCTAIITDTSAELTITVRPPVKHSELYRVA